MEDGAGGALLGGIVVVLVLGVALGIGLTIERRQRRRLRAWVQALGWRYARWRRGMHTGLSIGPIRPGRRQRSRAVLWGAHAGRPAASWEHGQVTWFLGSPRAERFHAVSIWVTGTLPDVDLRTAAGKAHPRPVRGPLSFEKAAFNARWRVDARDARAAYGLLHPRMMELLMREDPALKRANLTFSGNRVMLWYDGLWRHDLRQVDEALRLLDEIVRLIPRHVWEDAARPAQTRATLRFQETTVRHRQ